MFDFIKSGIQRVFRGVGGSPPRKPTRRPVSPAGGAFTASYDAAKTSPENQRHWANADDKPASLAQTPYVRQKLRMRARYEADNNGYCSGMVSTITTDTVGYVAPALQMRTKDKGFNSFVEENWNLWATNVLVNLPSKLRILDEGRRVEGENFLVMENDNEIGMVTGVMLGISVVPSSRVADPNYDSGTVSNGIYNDDGVLIDIKTGRPKGYKIVSIYDELAYGGSLIGSNTQTVPSRYCLHWFSPRRGGQFRGVCEFIPALPLFAQLRRYDLATLMAAETAALLAGIMKTTLPVAEVKQVEDWQKTELERGTLLTLPEGWDATQFKPEQPVTSYEMFVNCVLRQIGRTLDMPFGVIAGDSSRYNYSSARLDYTGYDERLKFDRQQLCIRVLTPLFMEWFNEFSKVNPTRVSASARALGLSHMWQFTMRPSIDPEKDAKTSTERINNGTSNLAIECAKEGKDWEDVMNQRSEEQKKSLELGLTSEQSSGIMSNDPKSAAV